MGLLRHQFCCPYCAAGPIYACEAGPTIFPALSMLLTTLGNASGITSPSGEQCLVTGVSGVHLEPCLESIAAGDGREVLQQDEAIFRTKTMPVTCVLFGKLFCQGGRIVNLADGTCLALADGDT